MTHGAVSDCLEGEGERIAQTGRCHTSLLTGKTPFPSNMNLFKEHSGEKVSVKDVSKSQWCGEQAAQKAQLCLGDKCRSRRREGERDTTAAEGEVVWLLIKLHPSAVFTAGTNSSVNFHSISHSGFTQAGAVFPGQEVLVSRSRWEQCEGSRNIGQCSWFRLRRHLPRGGKA